MCEVGERVCVQCSQRGATGREGRRERRGEEGGVKGPIHLEMLACSIRLGSRKFAFNYFLKVASFFFKVDYLCYVILPGSGTDLQGRN